jgi:hypothetical protein
MAQISQELSRLQKNIKSRRYKKAQAIVRELGVGLTTDKAKSKRVGEIKSHLKAKRLDWFLNLIYAKNSIENDNMIVAIFFLERILRAPKYRKARPKVKHALPRVLSPDLAQKLKSFDDSGWDWRLLNWLD